MVGAMPQMEVKDTYLLSTESQPLDDTGLVYDTKRWAKGKLMGGGVSGIVELLPNGQVVKSPWPGEEECEEDMAREARVYQRLSECFGAHERFIKLFSYDETEYAITMEYMVNGTLRSYLEAHNDCISKTRRHRWICELAEGMELLHSASLVHCDFSPRNMLLDESLNLKVADFGCVSIDGSQSSAGGSARFYPPRVMNRARIEIDDDLFALGSSIYEVLTGKPPYVDLSTSQVQQLFSLHQFPDLVELDFRDIIRDCWLLQAQTARDVHRRLLKLMSSQ